FPRFLCQHYRWQRPRPNHLSVCPNLRGHLSFAWLHNFRRLRIRFERLAAIHEAFMKIAACIIFWRHLQKSFC
ncbi:hypothetical protein ACPUER_36600, partial [Burkholderia sp. DN3021]